MSAKTFESAEVNFDGLIGPTHNYAGLSEGNLASRRNQNMLSRPRDAALQGLAKMRRLMGMGLPQGVLPPQDRPNIAWLRTLGFEGTDARVWETAHRCAPPSVLRAAAAASSMWAANAATISPSCDTHDNRLHASVANLQTMLHRQLEADGTERALRRLFADPAHFAVHAALTPHAALSDEGAANHMRLSAGPSEPGVEIFVYGREADETRTGFPARQTLEASQAIARRHGLNPSRTIFARQSHAAIDAGAFHNDVVAVAHRNVLFHHAEAFADKETLYRDVRAAAAGLFEPVFVEVPADAVSLDEAVTSYLFNAQLVSMPGIKPLTLIAPVEARENNRTAGFLAETTGAAGAAIARVDFVDVRESMRNGGGPACLRLRVEMTGAERAAATQGFFLSEALADALEDWVRRHYREMLDPADLADPRIVEECHTALDALTRILPLGSDFYAFQRDGG